MRAQELVSKLSLEPHVEGGYFRRTYQSGHRPMIVGGDDDGDEANRYLMSSIYYMLTREQPIGCMHRNKSDIMHVHNSGAPLRYYLLYPEGRLDTRVLGSNLDSGHELQFVVEGGVWKATELIDDGEHDYGLLTEVVVPGFDYADMTLGVQQSLLEVYPAHREVIERFCQ